MLRTPSGTVLLPDASSKKVLRTSSSVVLFTDASSSLSCSFFLSLVSGASRSSLYSFLSKHYLLISNLFILLGGDIVASEAFDVYNGKVVIYEHVLEIIFID